MRKYFIAISFLPIQQLINKLDVNVLKYLVVKNKIKCLHRMLTMFQFGFHTSVEYSGADMSVLK